MTTIYHPTFYWLTFLLVTDPSGVRFSVTGSVFGVENPRSTWAKYFGSSLVVRLDNPFIRCLSHSWTVAHSLVTGSACIADSQRYREELLKKGDVGPSHSGTEWMTSAQAVVMSLPTTESSFGIHTTMGVQGFDNPEYPAIRLAMRVLNAVEGYLWVGFTLNIYLSFHWDCSIALQSWVWCCISCCHSIGRWSWLAEFQFVSGEWTQIYLIFLWT